MTMLVIITADGYMSHLNLNSWKIIWNGNPAALSIVYVIKVLLS